MTWRETTVIRILLLVARMLDDGKWSEEIKNLANHISLGRIEVRQ